MVFVVIWLLCGLIAAAIGKNRDEGGLTFILGFILGPIGILIALLSKGKQAKCPYCKELIHQDATACPKCQQSLILTKKPLPQAATDIQLEDEQTKSEQITFDEFEEEESKIPPLLLIGIMAAIVVLAAVLYYGKQGPERMSDPHQLVPSKDTHQEIRVCNRDRVNIRTGPGTNFSLDVSGQLLRGESIYVLEEKNGWIRFRVTPTEAGWSGWVRKDLTVKQ